MRFATRFLLLSSLLISSGAAFGEDVDVKQIQTTISFERLDPSDKSAATKATAEAVRLVRNADTVLGQGDNQTALRNARRARTLLRRVQLTSPSQRLDHGLTNFRKQLLKKDGANADDLVPIYTELDEYQKITVATDVRVSVDAAKASVSGGQFEEAATSIEEAETKIRYVEIDLPVRETIVQLDRVVYLLDGFQVNMTPDIQRKFREILDSIEGYAKVASISLVEGEAEVSSGPE